MESGAIRPLTYCTFNKNEVEAAFRYMAAGKHIGKVTTVFELLSSVAVHLFPILYQKKSPDLVTNL